jgi:hypothetical protein
MEIQIERFLESEERKLTISGQGRFSNISEMLGEVA